MQFGKKAARFFMIGESVIPAVDPCAKEGLQQVRDLPDELAELQTEKSELHKLNHDFNMRH